MIKCFLSHSSRDKEKYVRLVAQQLRKETTIIDEDTFEEGMSPAEEIIRGLDETSLFVIFISNDALESKWVKQELKLAKQIEKLGKLERIYPVIIEENITHEDPRIPTWMKNTKNIQHIKQPKVAARKINSRLREIAWRHHPSLKEREKIFVGRNDKISHVETRFDDYSKIPPIVFIASGLTSIGRKSFIRHALTKANVVRDSYEFLQISLESNDSIEDFVLKLNDLGFTDPIETTDLLKTTIEQKIAIAVQLATRLTEERERVIIEDKGAIVLFNGEIIDWFKPVVEHIISSEHLTFCISSKFRANRSLGFKEQQYYIEEIPELDKTERNGLLSRYAKFRELSLERDDLSFFSSLLTGYPEQVIFAVDMIKETSIFEAKKNSHQIQEYATDKAKLIVESLLHDEKKLHFLYFLAKFEFISFDFLFDLVEESEYYEILNGFLLSSICERLGSNGDYIRVSEVVKDYISRSQFGLPSKFEDKLKIYVRDFLQNYLDDNKDISQYIFSIQHALMSGEQIPEKLLIPSYFLKTIKSLYDKGGSNNYKEVIKLADRVLLNEEYLHDNIVSHIYFLKCQALARLRDPDFFGVVKRIREPESSFLHGFYYRISGNQEKAINSYNRVLELKPNDFRVRSELVLIYLQSDEYTLAYDLAREVYERDPNNPINVNNYLSCIFQNKDKSGVTREKIEEIITRLESDKSERAQEMSRSARAKILAHYDNRVSEAFDVLEKTINDFPDVTYPILTLADLSIHYKNIEKLKKAIELLDKNETKNSQTYRTYIRYKACYFALTGQLLKGIQLAKTELHGVRTKTLDDFMQKLQSLSSSV